MSKTHFALASIPSRQLGLKKTVDCIIDQVDHIHVYLDGYDHIPDFLLSEKISVIKGSSPSVGDLGKLLPYQQLKDQTIYYLTGDDDLIYPPDYVTVMKEKIDKYERKAVISFHGARLPQCNITSYYNDKRIQRSHFASALEKDMRIHIPGTGVMGLYTGCLDIKVRESFRNMADIYIGCMARSRNVDVICASRKKEWIKPNRDLNEEIEDSIWGRSRNHDQPHTCLINTSFSTKMIFS